MTAEPASTAGTAGTAGTASWLRLDPVACDGIGMCAHRAPELVRLDSWGYPILHERELAGRDQRRARRAVAGCPRHALYLEPVDPRRHDPGEGSPARR